MNIIRGFTVKSMRIHRKWSVVTIIGVAISMALLSGVITFFTSAADLMLREQLRDYGKWTVSMQGVSASKAKFWRQVDEKNTVGITREAGCAAPATLNNPEKPYLRVIEMDNTASSQFYVDLTEGRLPRTDTEILLPEEMALASSKPYKIGDTITLSLGKRYLPDGTSLDVDSSYNKNYYIYNDDNPQGKNLGSEYLIPLQTRTYTVVGFMKTSILEDSWSASYICYSHTAADIESSSISSNLYIFRDSPPLTYYSDVWKQAKEAGIYTDSVQFNGGYLRYLGIQSPGERQDLLFYLIAAILIIIVATSASLIYNAFSISVSDRIRHLGLLASAGATRKQKRSHVYFEGFLVGLIGIPIGLLCGILGIWITFQIIGPLLVSIAGWDEMRLHLVVPWQAILVAILLECFTIAISVFVPAHRASRISPIDAIRQTKEIRLKPFRVRSPRWLRHVFGFEADLALKSYRRSSKRYRSTTISLVFSLILFLTASTYVEFTNTYNEISSSGINYDIQLSLNDISEAESQNILTKIRALPSISDASYQTYLGLALSPDKDLRSDITKTTGATSDSMFVSLIGLDDVSFREYAASVGENPDRYYTDNSYAGILLNKADEYNYDTGKRTIGPILNIASGDVLTVGNYGGSYFGDSSVPFTPIAEIRTLRVVSQGPLGVSTSQSFQNLFLILPEEKLESLAAVSGDSGDYYYSNPVINMTATNSHAAEKDLKEILKTVPSNQYSIWNYTTARERDANTVLLIKVFAYGFIGLIAMICVANLINTISTNVALRRKEFAMLRAVGMTPGSFNRMIRFESVFYGFKSLLFGMPISVLIAWLLYKKQLLVFTYVFSLPVESYIAAAVVVFALVFITMLFSVRKVNQENIIDALKIDTD